MCESKQPVINYNAQEDCSVQYWLALLDEHERPPVFPQAASTAR